MLGEQGSLETMILATKAKAISAILKYLYDTAKDSFLSVGLLPDTDKHILARYEQQVIFMTNTSTISIFF